MTAILAKELRGFTYPVAGLILAVYVLKAALVSRFPDLEFPGELMAVCYSGALFVAIFVGCYSLFACEGEKRTIVLLATLPIGRARIFAAKMLVLYGTLALVAVILAPLTAARGVVAWPAAPLENVLVGAFVVWLIATGLAAFAAASLTNGGIVAGGFLLQLGAGAVGLAIAEFHLVAALSAGVALLYAGRRAFALGDPFDARARWARFFGGLGLAFLPAVAVQLAFTHVALRAPIDAQIGGEAHGAGGLLLEYKASTPLGGLAADGMLRDVLHPAGGGPYASIVGRRAEILGSSPSGTRLLLGTPRTAPGIAVHHRSLYFWDPESGLTRIPDDPYPWSVVWSADERALLYLHFAPERQLRTFEPGKPPVTIPCGSVHAALYGFSPDGRQVWVILDGELFAFDRSGKSLPAKPGVKQRPWRAEPDLARFLGVRPSAATGSMIAEASDGSGRFYVTRLYRYAIAADTWTSIADEGFHAWRLGGPGGSRVIGVAPRGEHDRTLISIDLTTGATARREEPGSAGRIGLALAPDGRHLMIAEENDGRSAELGCHRVRLLDAATLAPLANASWSFEETRLARWVDERTVAAVSGDAVRCELLKVDGTKQAVAMPEARAAAAGAPDGLR